MGDYVKRLLPVMQNFGAGRGPPCCVNAARSHSHAIKEAVSCTLEDKVNAVLGIAE